MRLLSKLCKLVYVQIKKRKLAKRKVLLGRFVDIDDTTVLEGYNKVGTRSHINGANIGLGSYLGVDNDFSNAKIGRFCSIASNIKVLAGTHPMSPYVSFHPSFFSISKQAGFTFSDNNYFEEIITVDGRHSCVIGNDVWIGTNCLILAGVKIGDGAMIAAGSVVVNDVEAYTVVGGIPARLIKYRFTSEEISFLNKFKWWDKDLLWLQNNVELMRDINQFRDKYE